MGKMGCGYGSEFHLLRYLGYHRTELNREVEEKTGGRVLDWLDFEFDPKRKPAESDVELKGLAFLGQEGPTIEAWKKFRPQTGNVQNWDAVGRLQTGSQIEYLLVEAKGHVEEIRSDCNAKERGGLPKIRDAFAETIKACCSDKTVDDWLSPYYQYANRLAALHFLLKHNVPARLIFIYFLGDQWPNGKNSKGQPVTCPGDKQEWETALDDIHIHLGLTGSSPLEQRVHPLFLHLSGPVEQKA
jgi:hypothetical protein